MKTNKFNYGIICIILFIAVVIPVGFNDLFSLYTNRHYTEVSVTKKDIINNDTMLKNISLYNGRFKTEDENSSITYIDEHRLGEAATVTVNVNSIAEGKAKAIIYFIDTDEYVDATFYEGKNVFWLKNKVENAGGFEVYFTEKSGVIIDISSIVINSREDIAQGYQNNYSKYIKILMFIILIAAGNILFYDLSHRRLKIKIRKIVALSVVLSAGLVFVWGECLYFFYTLLVLAVAIFLYPKITGWVFKTPQKFKNQIIMLVCGGFTATGIMLMYYNFNILAFLFLFYTAYFMGRVGFNPKKIKPLKIYAGVFTAGAVVYITGLFTVSPKFIYSQLGQNIQNCMTVLIIEAVLFIIFAINNNRKELSGKSVKCLAYVLMVCQSVVFAVTGNGFVPVILALSLLAVLTVEIQKNDKYGVSYVSCKRELLFGPFSIVLVIAANVITEIVYNIYILNGAESIRLFEEVFKISFTLSVLLGIILYFTVTSIFGRYLGTVINIILYLVLVIGNFILMKYQKKPLMPGDLMHIKELLSIAGNYINIFVEAGLCIALVAVIVFFIKNIKKLTPRPMFLLAIVLVLYDAFVVSMIFGGKLQEVNISFNDRIWRIEEERLGSEGLTLFNMLNVDYLRELMPKPPEGYSPERMAEIKEYFNSLETENNGTVTPNVILVMMESLSDIESYDFAKFNQPLLSDTVRNLKRGATISPSYGGGTSNVEFEALTGCCKGFFSTQQYFTMKWQHRQHIPSIVSEFNSNNYSTTMIHPNTPHFYNRDFIYEAMGFNEYLNILSFPKDVKTNNSGYVLDEEISPLIKSQIEKYDEPQFIFTITIEGHSPYSKYDDDEGITAESDVLTQAAIEQLNNYGVTVKHASNFIEDLYEYVMDIDEPTSVYIFGDHLPPMSCYTQAGITNDFYTKYRTVLFEFSNWRSTTDETIEISTNFLAAKILKECNIKTNSYFNFMYKLMKEKKILHGEKLENDENEQIFKLMQYDLLYGKQYLLLEQEE